jgi:hypothetical protein
MQFEASRNFLQKSAPNEKKIIRKIRQSAAAQHFPEKPTIGRTSNSHFEESENILSGQ